MFPMDVDNPCVRTHATDCGKHVRQAPRVKPERRPRVCPTKLVSRPKAPTCVAHLEPCVVVMDVRYGRRHSCLSPSISILAVANASVCVSPVRWTTCTSGSAQCVLASLMPTCHRIFLTEPSFRYPMTGLHTSPRGGTVVASYLRISHSGWRPPLTRSQCASMI